MQKSLLYPTDLYPFQNHLKTKQMLTFYLEVVSLKVVSMLILLLVAPNPQRKSSYLVQYEPNADFPL